MTRSHPLSRLAAVALLTVLGWGCAASSSDPVTAPEGAMDEAATREAEVKDGAMATAGAATVESRTLNGEFAWADRTTGDLEAVFTPTGEDAWDVSFHFEFRGKPHTYTGTAEGNLESGSLDGRVQNENKKRTWEFSGEFEGETYNGQHWELYGDDDRSLTGTLTLTG